MEKVCSKITLQTIDHIRMLSIRMWYLTTWKMESWIFQTKPGLLRLVVLGHQRARLRKREHIEPRQETAKKQIQLVKNKLFCKVLWFGKMAINQLLSEMCEILREHRCAILCKRQSLFFILLQFMVRMMLWLPWLPFSIWFKSLAQRGIPVEKIATLEDECHAYCLLTINSGSAQFQIPPKSLNVHDFGMKMYAPQPITALLERKAELWLAKRSTFSCLNHAHSGTLTIAW